MPGTVRRVVAAGTLLGALALVLVAQAGPAGAATTCPAPSAGMASVAVVVDSGTGDPVVRCVTVKEGSTGRDALVAAGLPFRVGTGTPADNNQGGAFLCGILGVPQAGCAAPSSKGVSYWAYYRQAAGAPWTYSRVGFFTPVASRCAVEGWRWTTAGGVAAADNPRPRVAPPAVDCSSPAVPPATAPPARPAPAPAVTAAPKPPSPVAGVAGTPTSLPPATTTTAPAAQVEGRTVEAPVAAADGATTSAPEQRRGPATSATVERSAGSTDQAAGSADRSSDAGVPWVAAGAVALAALIGVGAFLRGRRQG